MDKLSFQVIDNGRSIYYQLLLLSIFNNKSVVAIAALVNVSFPFFYTTPLIAKWQLRLLFQ
jgi:hypothetical protein